MFEITKEIIIQQTEELFSAAVFKYAKRLKVEPQQVQIVLGLNSENEVTYTLLKDYKPAQKLDLKDITGLAMYFVLKEHVPLHVSGGLKRIAAELEAMSGDITLMIMCDENESLHYCIYKETEFIRVTSLDETIKIE